jgi:hypothetical protein
MPSTRRTDHGLIVIASHSQSTHRATKLTAAAMMLAWGSHGVTGLASDHLCTERSMGHRSRISRLLSPALDRKTACFMYKDELFYDDVQRTYHESLAFRAGIVSRSFTAERGISHGKLTLPYSIGGFYAFILGRSANVELSVVARSNYDAVKTEVCAPTLKWSSCADHKITKGLSIDSANHGQHSMKIDHGV